MVRGLVRSEIGIRDSPLNGRVLLHSPGSRLAGGVQSSAFRKVASTAAGENALAQLACQGYCCGRVCADVCAHVLLCVCTGVRGTAACVHMLLCGCFVITSSVCSG